MKFSIIVGLLAVATSATTPAAAYVGYGLGKVTLIEVTYMPNSINVRLDTAIAGCAAGAWLAWLPYGSTQSQKDQNAQAVLATLLTAKVSGQQVQAFVKNAGCQIEYLYLS
jgi:hypothetical protein